MTKENNQGKQTETEAPAVVTEKRIHKTHFPVPEIPLRDRNYDTGYEWIQTGDGRWKRVPRTKVKED